MLLLTPMPMLKHIMVDIMVDTMAEDMDMAGMVDTDTDTTVAKDLPMLKPNPTTVMAEMADMADMAEDTDMEDTEVMVDTVMAVTEDIMVEKFSHDQVTRI